MTERPTVVLVHGAFADAGSWTPVIEQLQAEGVEVRALVNPLRGLSSDGAYVASAIAQIPGPVLAVGHSYGGAQITTAPATATNIVGLVYVAGFAPEEGETLQEIEGTSRDSALGPALIEATARDSALAPALTEATYPVGDNGETAVELYVDPAKFPAVFAGDLPAPLAAALGASQRPVAAAAFGEKSGPAGWKTLPSWAVVATGDKAAGADAIRSVAVRAGAQITEVESSHLVMLSQPAKVTAVILAALRAVS